MCSAAFSPEENRFPKPSTLRCPYCSRALVCKKERKQFAVHKCVNPKCPYYLHNLKKVDKEDLKEDYGKNKYKLHYIYREFTVDFFRMDLNSLPKNASSLKFTKYSAHTMSLCLTLRVNLGLSLRKTSQALKDLYGIRISHQQIANYCKTAAMCVKPFVDHYDYKAGSVFTADETYIKVRGIKGYVWLIMDAAKRSIIGCQTSDNRGVGPCIPAMRMVTELGSLTQEFPTTMRNAILQSAIQGNLSERLKTDTLPYELIMKAKKSLAETLDGQRVKKKIIQEINESDIPFEIPKTWEWVRLGTICIIARGGSPRPITNFITTSEDGINWIKIGDTEKNVKYICSTAEKIKPEGAAKSRFVHASDFLLTNSMSYGRPYILNINGCIHDGWLVISQPIPVFDQDYLYWLLSSYKVANSIFPLPPIEEQQRIVQRLEKLMPLCEKIYFIQLLQTTRKT